MLTSFALLAPHLPTLLVDQHRGHHTEMLEALARTSERLLAESPQVVVVLSARWNASGPFLVDAGKRHGTLTDYPGFGVEVRYDCPGHPALARSLVAAGQKAGVRVAVTSRGVDSGVTVPMHFLFPRGGVRVVPLSLAPRPPEECSAWGETLRRALTEWRERAVFVVGGVLSHNPHAVSLRRDVPESREFDARLLDAIGRGAWDELVAEDRAVIEKVQPESELRHLEVMRGFVSAGACGEVRCYESGPGVGAALVEFPLAEIIEAPDSARARGMEPG